MLEELGSPERKSWEFTGQQTNAFIVARHMCSDHSLGALPNSIGHLQKLERFDSLGATSPVSLALRNPRDDPISGAASWWRQACESLVHRSIKREVLFWNANRPQALLQGLGTVPILTMLYVHSDITKYNIRDWEFDWNWSTIMFDRSDAFLPLIPNNRNFNRHLWHFNLLGHK